jgi:hypothetical protein
MNCPHCDKPMENPAELTFEKVWGQPMHVECASQCKRVCPRCFVHSWNPKETRPQDPLCAECRKEMD